MDIDQRLEALTQTVELLASMHRDSEGRMEQLETSIEGLVETAKQDGENIRALARIAEIHERRITHLEGDEQ